MSVPKNPEKQVVINGVTYPRWVTNSEGKRKVVHNPEEERMFMDPEYMDLTVKVNEDNKIIEQINQYIDKFTDLIDSLSYEERQRVWIHFANAMNDYYAPEAGENDNCKR